MRIGHDHLIVSLFFLSTQRIEMHKNFQLKIEEKETWFINAERLLGKKNELKSYIIQMTRNFEIHD